MLARVSLFSQLVRGPVYLLLSTSLSSASPAGFVRGRVHRSSGHSPPCQPLGAVLPDLPQAVSLAAQGGHPPPNTTLLTWLPRIRAGTVSCSCPRPQAAWPILQEAVATAPSVWACLRPHLVGVGSFLGRSLGVVLVIVGGWEQPHVQH